MATAIKESAIHLQLTELEAAAIRGVASAISGAGTGRELMEGIDKALHAADVPVLSVKMDSKVLFDT